MKVSKSRPSFYFLSNDSFSQHWLKKTISHPRTFTPWWRSGDEEERGGEENWEHNGAHMCMLRRRARGQALASVVGLPSAPVAPVLTCHFRGV